MRAARVPPVHPAARAEAARVSPPLFLPLPLSSGQQADEDKVWGHYLVHPRLYPQVRLDAAADFSLFPIQDRFASPCRSSSIHRRPSRRTRLLLRPLGCSDDVRDQATLPVSPPFQAVVLLTAGLCQAGAQSASAPPVVLARTSPPMFLKEDVVATPDLSATLDATCAVATPVLSVT